MSAKHSTKIRKFHEALRLAKKPQILQNESAAEIALDDENGDLTTQLIGRVFFVAMLLVIIFAVATSVLEG